MSEQINNGGPAFPNGYVNPAAAAQAKAAGMSVSPPAGMTLRDYFAAKAMQALIQSGAAVQRHTADGVLTLPSRVGVPPLAYEYADAMLAARGDA